MAYYDDNVLRQVETYQKAGIKLLTNSCALLDSSDKKFQNFQDYAGNLGSSVTFEIAPKMAATDSLTATFAPVQQRYITLSVDKAASTSFGFTTQQCIYYDALEYSEKFGMSAINVMGSKIEASLGQTLLDNTFRFYGDGKTDISSYSKMAEMVKYFENYGSVKSNYEAFIPDIEAGAIVSTGLQQFVPKRNEEDIKQWQLGYFANTLWSESNLLPIHYAGKIGQANQSGPDCIITVVSVDDPTGNYVTSATCTVESTWSNQSGLILKNDVAQLLDGYPSPTYKNRYTVWNAQAVSRNRVQLAASKDSVPAVGTSIVFNFRPALCWVPTNPNYNTELPITAGVKIQFLPSHRAGFMMSGKPLYVGMPKLNEMIPYPTANQIDPETGAFVRMYLGSGFGLGTTSMVYDTIYGSTAIPEQVMRILFPL